MKDIADVARGLEEIASSLRSISNSVKEPLVRTIAEEEFKSQQAAEAERYGHILEPGDDSTRNVNV